MGVEYKATEQDEGAAAVAGDAAGDHQDGLAPSILGRGVSDREPVVGAEGNDGAIVVAVVVGRALNKKIKKNKKQKILKMKIRLGKYK